MHNDKTKKPELNFQVVYNDESFINFENIDKLINSGIIQYVSNTKNGYIYCNRCGSVIDKQRFHIEKCTITTFDKTLNKNENVIWKKTETTFNYHKMFSVPYLRDGFGKRYSKEEIYDYYFKNSSTYKEKQKNDEENRIKRKESRDRFGIREEDRGILLEKRDSEKYKIFNKIYKRFGYNFTKKTRKPKTTNERKQFDQSIIDGFSSIIRGKRRKNRLPNSRDSIKPSCIKDRSWKNMKIMKQWMANL